MTATDLIRLAEELARCGGVHRFNSLVAAASHVLLEHERGGVERWERIPWELGQPQPRISDGVYDGIRMVAGGGFEGLRRRCRVEAWEDGPETGVGMTDKVALASTPAGPAIIDRYKADRDAASRAPEGAEASGEIEENVGESRLSCYKRPVEEVQLPDGSNQWQEGPRQWLSET